MKIRIPERAFNEVYLPYLYTRTRNEIYYGGASSGKSRFVAQKKIVQHLSEKGRKTLVVKKVAKTIRHSAFAEIVGVLNAWNLRGLFKVNKSDMEIIRKDGATSFVFAGLDDVEKLKSIVGITDVWVEEATEITQEDYQQLNIRMRGGTLSKQIILSFNPVSALSWIKKYFFDQKRENTSILKTTYLDNRFLNKDDHEILEQLKNDDPVYYRIYALGEWGVLGNLVWTNYTVEDFDKNAFTEQQLYHGADWGFNEPSAIIRIGFKDAKIYIIDGIYAKGLTNTELIKEVAMMFTEKDLAGEEYVNKDYSIIGDSSEPARIKEFRQHGWKMRPAKKGKDSVKFGIDFVRRHEIIIHPSVQDFINEISAYKYREDKDGNILDEPLDVNNHYMDATRYSLEDLAHERRIKWG